MYRLNCITIVCIGIDKFSQELEDRSKILIPEKKMQFYFTFLLGLFKKLQTESKGLR